MYEKQVPKLVDIKLLFVTRDSVNYYALHIAEDDGEVDWDFPALDINEPISRFGFSKLALVERDIPIMRRMSTLAVTM